MKTLKIFLFLLLMIGINAFGQKTDTTYLGSDWKPSTKQLSSYFRVTKTIEEGKKYEISDYYKTGELQMTGNYSSLNPNVWDGEFNWYYKNGKQKAKNFYKRDELQSEMSWDANGKQTLQKEYQKLNLIKDGKETYEYVTMDKFPKYPGGMSELYKFISAKFIMPENVQYSPGKVVIKFIVDRDGSIVDVQIAQSVHPSIDKEALRVVKSLPKWEPGIQNGKNVRVNMNVPIRID